MAQPLDVRHLLATGSQLTEAGRSQAVQLGTDLVEQGRQTTDQIRAVIEKLVNPVGRNRDDDLHRDVRAEVSEQLRTLGSEIKNHLAEGQLGADRIAELRRQRREYAEELRDVVRDEIHRQLSALDLVSKEDLTVLGHALLEDLRALERRWTPVSTTASQDDLHAEAPLHVTPPHERGRVIDPPTI